jgi:hypothetical protein
MYIRAYDVGADGKLGNMRKLISWLGSAPDVPDGLNRRPRPKSLCPR